MVDFLHLYSNFDRILCKQTVETLTRRRVFWHLIWVHTVSLCHTKRTLGLNGLNGKCIKGLIWPPLEPKYESCFSPFSSDRFIRRITQCKTLAFIKNLLVAMVTKLPTK